MSIARDVDDELKRAMHARDHHTVNVIRMLKSRGLHGGLDDAAARRIIIEYRNQMYQALQLYANVGDRGVEHADQLILEVAFCERFVAPLLDRAALRALVQQVIGKIGRDRDAVIRDVMIHHREQVIGAEVAQIVDELLATAPLRVRRDVVASWVIRCQPGPAEDGGADATVE
jgi:uncharacterized protein YqeY